MQLPAKPVLLIQLSASVHLISSSRWLSCNPPLTSQTLDQSSSYYSFHYCHHWTSETTIKYCFEHIELFKNVLGKLNIKLISLWNGRKRLAQTSQEHTDCAHSNHKILLPKLRTKAGCRNSRFRNRASQTWFGMVISEFLKNVVGRVPWVELDRAGWARPKQSKRWTQGSARSASC